MVLKPQDIYMVKKWAQSPPSHHTKFNVWRILDISVALKILKLLEGSKGRHRFLRQNAENITNKRKTNTQKLIIHYEKRTDRLGENFPKHVSDKELLFGIWKELFQLKNEMTTQ